MYVCMYLSTTTMVVSELVTPLSVCSVHPSVAFVCYSDIDRPR